jgi:urocanate hydratase
MLVNWNMTPDIVTDQTPAHDLSSYVPIGDLKELDELREADREEYHRRVLSSIQLHVEAILEMQRRGAIVFDYGNNLREQAERAGVNIRDEKGGFKYKGFVLAKDLLDGLCSPEIRWISKL